MTCDLVTSWPVLLASLCLVLSLELSIASSFIPSTASLTSAVWRNLLTSSSQQNQQVNDTLLLQAINGTGARKSAYLRQVNFYRRHAPFSKILRGHVWTVPGNMPVLQRNKFEVGSFSRFGVLELLAFNAHFQVVWLTGPLRTHRQKHTQTDTHRTNTLSPPFTWFTWRR